MHNNLYETKNIQTQHHIVWKRNAMLTGFFLLFCIFAVTSLVTEADRPSIRYIIVLFVVSFAKHLISVGKKKMLEK